MKRCTKCGKWKNNREFSKHRTNKDKLQNRCKECTKEYNAKYHGKHKEERKEYYRKYQEEHAEEGAESTKKYKRCVKNPTCPAVGDLGAKFVLVTCPACRLVFRKSEASVDWAYEHRGQTNFYCSRECYNKSMRKHKQRRNKDKTKM